MSLGWRRTERANLKNEGSVDQVADQEPCLGVEGKVEAAWRLSGVSQARVSLEMCADMIVVDQLIGAARHRESDGR